MLGFEPTSTAGSVVEVKKMVGLSCSVHFSGSFVRHGRSPPRGDDSLLLVSFPG